MQLDKIITLANKATELRFLAMERSLRATGCNLPLWVIPYDDNKFDLPENAVWWEIEEMMLWLKANNTIKIMRKYQCLLTSNFQYADTDIIFLKNPEHQLADFSGWISSCGHWHNPQQTYTNETAVYYKNASTTWQKSVFNAGQFACDKQLYNFKTLQATTENPLYAPSVLTTLFGEQIGLNLLVHLAGIPVTNLTLPPNNMESTWAGDYGENFEKYWTTEAKKPYLIHWAGCKMGTGRPIDEIFLTLLTAKERQEWDMYLADKSTKENKWNKKLYRNLRRVKHAFTALKFE